MNPLIAKALIILLMLMIFISLGTALYYLVHDEGKTDHVVKALSWRIGLSFLLFILLLIAYALGWIRPN